MSFSRILSLFLMCGPAGLACGAEIDLKSELPPTPALEPEAALGAFRVQPGFRVELVAAEPLLQDPVAIDFDEAGRMFVVELPQYNQYILDGEITDCSRVRMLEDADGDGRMDRSTIYVDNLPYATAVACWDGGVFVGVAPDLLYCKDTDGDGKADEHRVVLTGFAVSPGRAGQAQLNSIRWGLDNRFHICGNLSGGNVRLPGPSAGDAIPVSIRNRDLAFDPRTMAFEARSGGGQHGMGFDDWGRKFTCKNSEPFRMIYYDERYLRNNPYLAAPAPSLEITEEKKYTKLFRMSGDEPWRVLRTKMRATGLFAGPVEGPGGTAAPSGYFTAATGVAIYRGDGWPEEYRGNAFVGEVSNNLVYRARLDPDGVGFVARRAQPDAGSTGSEPGAEFLASTDNLFRPVQLANAPDGSLNIVDMYRELIEGAAFLPPEVLKHIHVTGGVGRGRIYRVMAETEKGERAPVPDLGAADAVELVALLEHPNAWHRETASRLLYGRQDAVAIAPLRDLARTSESALGRMHAWYALEGLGALDAETISIALGDPGADAREHAIRLAEELAAGDVQTRAKLFALTQDDALRVRYQAAFSLGAISSDEKGEAIVAFLSRDGADPWMRLAGMSAIGEEAGEVFSRVLADAELRATEHGVAILEQLAAQLAEANRLEEIEGGLNAITALPAGEAALSRSLLRAMLDHSKAGARRQLAESKNPVIAKALHEMIRNAREKAFDVKLESKVRVAAIRALSFVEFETAREGFAGLLQSNQPQEVQLAALAALEQFEDPGVGSVIIDAWPSLSPAIRPAAMETLLSRPAWALTGLGAIGAGMIGKGEFGMAQVASLRAYPDETVRVRAEELFSGGLFRARDAVVASYKGVFELQGNPVKGKAEFGSTCAACHRLEKAGNAIGADLTGIGQRGAEEILLHILDPNREVKPEHLLYTVQTASGENHLGMITAESAGGVTLRRLDGIEVKVLRVNIAGMKGLGISYMPEGLENVVSVPAMADLLAYLKSVK